MNSHIILNSCYTVDLVIFACLNFHEFAIVRFFKKSRFREFSISMIGSAIKIKKNCDILNSRIFPPSRKFKLPNITRY